MKINRIGLLGFDGVQALDLTGPAEVLAAATVEEDGNESLSGAMALLPDVIESVSIFARVKCPKVGNLFLISN